VQEARAVARAEARAEAEAAAEQRLAALDQARREEREAAVAEALALGARRVSARPYTCSSTCRMHTFTTHSTPCHQTTTEHGPLGYGMGFGAAARAAH